jgi:N6-adenosine-specific RNA methylase IME4
MIRTPGAAVKYGVILADPPWTFATYSSKGKGRSAEAHYDCMSLDEIKALPVTEWAADDAALYLWATAPHLANSLTVMSAWGFTYKSNFVWTKERIGTGYWARNRHEHLLIGARGSKVCPRFNGIAPVDSVIEGQQRQHSQKPDRPWGDEVGLLNAGVVATRRWASQGAGVGVLPLAEAA